MNHILIVEDDSALSNGITLALKSDDIKFVQAYDLKTAEAQLSKIDFDLVILDLNLPDGNGLHLLQQIRKSSAIPVIVLTANDMETDIVTGFELGADDYITKPFSLMVLRARVGVQLRKNKLTQQAVFSMDHFNFSFDKMEFLKAGQAVELSKTEQKLLRALVENRGHVMARCDLIDKIWTYGAEYVDENALSVTIKRLRDKLESDPSSPSYIKTVYGMGYTWAVVKP